MTKAFGRDVFYADHAQTYQPSWLVDDPRLRDHLPPDAQESVERASERWRQKVRNRLEAETRLKLTDAVPVKVKDGMPIPFAKLIQEFDDPDLWWLTARRELFTVTHEGLAELSNAASIPRPLLRTAGMDDSLQEPIERISGVIRGLLESKKAEEFYQKLREIDHDILGAYFFNQPEVQLYWMVIAFFAARLKVRLEDLTIVVLAHELAHAFTHLGGDADGSPWETDSFADANLRIVEGLAQFYTERVVVSLANEQPGAQVAFDALLSMQSLPYTIFKEWTHPSEPRRNEIVRTAMINTRTTRNTNYEIFRQALEQQIEILQASPQ
jgi:hypothetical protein